MAGMWQHRHHRPPVMHKEAEAGLRDCSVTAESCIGWAEGFRDHEGEARSLHGVGSGSVHTIIIFS